MLNRDQNGKYWREWAATKRVLMPGRETWTKHQEETYRHAVHREALGYDKSHSDFSNDEFSRVLSKMRELRNPSNLDAVMRVLAFWNHDNAQATHVPVIQPGKPRGRDYVLRTTPSRYERMTAVDDPGARKQRIYVIDRLFAPPMVDKICFDRWQVRDWRELPLPQLTELRDLLKARLGKFITKVKQGKIDYDFGFSAFNPETGRDFPNDAIIAILLRRGQRVDMRDNRKDRAPLKASDARPVCNSGGRPELSSARAVEVPF